MAKVSNPNPEKFYNPHLRAHKKDMMCTPVTGENGKFLFIHQMIRLMMKIAEEMEFTRLRSNRRKYM